MASGDANRQRDAEGADLWDVAADERQRLADEREHLANERERLADEREQLADERDRAADQRLASLSGNPDLGVVLDQEYVRMEAEAQVLRAEARLRRAVAEGERARSSLERLQQTVTRHDADRERIARRAAYDDDDRWEIERRAFVSVERERLADVREQSQAARDDDADRRERDADHRDRAAYDRERALNSLEYKTVRDLAARSTANDLRELRERAERQRRNAARARKQAEAERAAVRRDERRSSFAPDAYGPALAGEFVDLTRELFATPHLSEVADRVLGFAAACLPNDVAMGVTISGGLPTLQTATNAIAEHLDALQIDSGYGPSVDALGSSVPVCATTLAAWPELASVATELGITAALAYPLSVPRQGRWLGLGVLSLYAENPRSLDDDTRDISCIIAAYLAVAAGFERDRHDLSRREAALHRALSSRDIIGQAKGILMERQRIPAGEAFDILRRTSQRLNVRLREVAARVAETGTLPS